MEGFETSQKSYKQKSHFQSGKFDFETFSIASKKSGMIENASDCQKAFANTISIMYGV